MFWAQVEGRLLAMLEGVEALSLEQLNEATLAWVEREYHRKHHSELGCAPLERYRTGTDVARPCPDAQTLRQHFRLQTSRKQRRSDGTCSVLGRRFEVPSRFRHLDRLTLRIARWDLASVSLIDPLTEQPTAELYPLDKTRNAERGRRALQPAVNAETDLTAPSTPPSGDVAPLLAQLMAEYAATGLPPAYLPFHHHHNEPEPQP